MESKLASRSSKDIHYHFELAFDDAKKIWQIIDIFDGLELKPIRDNGKWRMPIIPSERNKLKRRRRELQEAIMAINEGKASSLEALGTVTQLRTP